MSTRPKIPADIARAVLTESGHRCAVCGDPCPLERAHIIPWHKSKSHKAENLICLCASCHERADLEGWGERTLRVYKSNPWVLRKHILPIVLTETSEATGGVRSTPDRSRVQQIGTSSEPSILMGRDVAHEEIVDEGIPQVPERGFGVGLDSFRGQKVAKPGLSDNPYFHLPQGFDPSRYYGSQVWTDLTLQNASAHPPRPIEFTGLPGMGKSTCLRYLAHPQGALDKNRTALHPPFSDEPWLMFMVLAEFRLLPTDAHPFEYLYERFFTAYENHKAVHKSNLDQWPDVLPINDKLSPDDATSLIEDFLTILKRIGVRAVFLLDDFHLAFKKLSLAQTTRLRPWRDRAAFVISTEYRLEKVNAQAAGSPFFQTLPSVPFGGLMADEARHLLRDPASRAGWPFAPDDIRFTLTQAGTHPHLLITAGAVLWELRKKLALPKRKKAAVSREYQQLLFGHFKEQFLSTFQMYTEHLEESEKRALIATVKNEDLDKHYPALAYLEKLGLVQFDSNGTAKYRPFSPLFGEYIQQVAGL